MSKKLLLLLRPWLQNSYLFLILVLFLPVSDQALGHKHLLPVNPTILCLVTLSPHALYMLYRRHSWHFLFPSNLCPLLPLFAMAGLALGLSSHPTAFWEENGKWIFLIPYGLLVIVLASIIGYRYLSAQVLTFASIVSLALLLSSIITDYVTPGTFAPLGTRAAGFSGNANFSALVAVFICASALRYTPAPFGEMRNKGILASLVKHSDTASRRVLRSIVNPLLFCLTSLIIILTMSRSGAIHLVSLYLFFCFHQMFFSKGRPLTTLVQLIITPVVVSMVALIILSSYADSPLLRENTRLNRLIHNRQVDDGSASSRYQAAIDSLSLIEQAPILGHGTGFSRTMKELPHNLYLQQWVNNGVFGFLLYVLFLLSGFITFTKRRYPGGQALCVVGLTGSIFSHNILDQRPFLILFGFALGLSLRYQPMPRIVLLPNERRIAQDMLTHELQTLSP